MPNLLEQAIDSDDGDQGPPSTGIDAADVLRSMHQHVDGLTAGHEDILCEIHDEVEGAKSFMSGWFDRTLKGQLESIHDTLSPRKVFEQLKVMRSSGYMNYCRYAADFQHDPEVRAAADRLYELAMSPIRPLDVDRNRAESEGWALTLRMLFKSSRHELTKDQVLQSAQDVLLTATEEVSPPHIERQWQPI